MLRNRQNLMTDRLDPRDFRRTLGCFATGVTVVTTLERSGRHVGLTVNSFASVSLDPPLVLWCLSSNSPSLEAFLEAPSFVISVLAATQRELVQRFARYADDKFAGVDWRPGANGVPILTGTTATFECRRERVVDAGDHHVLFGEVVGYRRGDVEPLIYCQGSLLPERT